MNIATLRCEITGLVPLLVHNGHLADPLNDVVKAMREVSGKRKKTEADHEALAELELIGGLYTDRDGICIMPSRCLEAVLIEGAKKSRSGPKAKAGICVPSDAPILNGSGKTIHRDVVLKEKRHQSREMVSVDRKKIVRTRPMFPDWSITFDVEVFRDVVNPSEVAQWLEAGGRLSGLGDWRPRHGRFAVQSAVVLKDADAA